MKLQSKVAGDGTLNRRFGYASANFNYLLSDYSKDDGALGFVPGSHRWRRWPSPEEAAYWNERMQPVEAPMGAMIIWGDHTWHGSYPRKTDGLRLMMLGTYCRPHMQTSEIKFAIYTAPCPVDPR